MRQLVKEIEFKMKTNGFVENQWTHSRINGKNYKANKIIRNSKVKGSTSQPQYDGKNESQKENCTNKEQ